MDVRSECKVKELHSRHVAFINLVGMNHKSIPLRSACTPAKRFRSLPKIQQGKEPDDWKPMASIGSGVQEIRVRDDTGTYRVFYVAKFQEAVYVLHVFKKRSQKTARPDIELGKSRYADLLTWRREVGL